MMSDFLSTVFAAWSKAWPILFAVLFFGLIILSHELGHFFFAKLFNVKVNKFAIGMGPPILKKKRGETEYSLRIFPIGGYVIMEGEDEESFDERSFDNAKVWKRMIIIAAGAVVNLVLALFIVMFMLSQESLIGTPQINRFFENSTTQQSGLEKDDVIKMINGRNVYSEYDLSFLLSRDKDGLVDFVVERDGQKIAVNNVRFEMRENSGGGESMVLDFIIVGVEPTFLSVIKYSALEAVSFARIVWISLFDLVTGQYGFKDLSGPIGTVSYIAQVTQQTVQTTDLTPILTMLTLVSVNIGVFNLLPIPALDGGKLFFLFIELIRRKKINPKYESLIHAAGFMLLIGMMAAVSLSDIIKLVRGDLA
ncbi:MAG: RIP metalloprotease RseP [Clostridiales bacterium]|jgi:regulator of sigma E protease|nr:RIP metalloprotease RseP [Clostridiales bacterium]